ncbi:MAG: ShlB/FhaC/HecB family hemolysin secretion/activation protein [Accumulibacter sp.]|jgi:hemolysin activation/secretion protein|uniref:ShlB/FhaC/HecB family hemolysin secretion/activation protein n=1 Tax=Accumulibacter sp. TaxID=2053492 RepID=UPI001AC5E59C|nr:ShlB/FhaC/HecB family hemolysin secretion/activation protein [Accumulibacter sp.]MBN8438600.1 ShlB/FhaC/HecB family hemolysin secretion/activation protein [Accumulibacter sp.]
MLKNPLRAAATALSALAASSALPIEPDHLNLQEPERPAYLVPPPAGRFTLPPIPPDGAVAVTDAAVVILEGVRFVGNTVIGNDDLQAVAAPYLGKALGAADVETLRQKVSLLYIDRGYVNSGALLPADPWDRGTLTLQIIEGRLKEVRLRGLGRLNEHYVADRLARDDEPLNIQTLSERFQLLLADPLFARMSGQLLPDVERGKAILDVDIERARPYQLSLFANNYLPISIGPQSGTIAGWVRNLTGYGDVLEASYQDPLGHGEARRGAIGWRLPLNTWGTQLSVSYDHGVSSVIQQPTQPLDISSHLTDKEIGVGQVLLETLRQKLSIGLNRVWRENSTELFGFPFSFVAGEPTGTSKARDWRFWQEYTHRSENQVLALRSVFTFGENNELPASAFPVAGLTLDHDYRIWLGQAQYARRVLDNGTQFILRFNVQKTSDRLIPMEQMSVGGINTVRGYLENQLVRDNGVVSNVEFDFPVLADPARRLSVNLKPFFDYGRAWNSGEDAAVITSLGVAGRLRWYGLTFDLSVAKRLHHSGTVISNGSNLQEQGIELQLSYDFF